MYLATRNAALEPLSALAFGLQVAGDGRELTVFLPAVLSPLDRSRTCATTARWR